MPGYIDRKVCYSVTYCYFNHKIGPHTIPYYCQLLIIVNCENSSKCVFVIRMPKLFQSNYLPLIFLIPNNYVEAVKYLKLKKTNKSQKQKILTV